MGSGASNTQTTPVNNPVVINNVQSIKQPEVKKDTLKKTTEKDKDNIRKTTEKDAQLKGQSKLNTSIIKQKKQDNAAIQQNNTKTSIPIQKKQKVTNPQKNETSNQKSKNKSLSHSTTQINSSSKIIKKQANSNFKSSSTIKRPLPELYEKDQKGSLLVQKTKKKKKNIKDDPKLSQLIKIYGLE